jgi:hypothetical protein
MADEAKNQQSHEENDDAAKKGDSSVESKHVIENTGGPKTEAGLPGQGQKGENDRDDSKRGAA